jgi:ketosteroid isomerase-like protein
VVRRPLPAALAIAAAGLAAWALWGWLWPDETSRVRAATAQLARAVTALGAAGGGLGQVGAVRDLGALLTEDVTLEAPERALRVDGRDQALALAAGLATRGRRGTLSFDDVGVRISADGASAVVTATARLTGRGADGRAEIDAQEVALDFARAGRVWRLRGARTVDVLR